MCGDGETPFNLAIYIDMVVFLYCIHIIIFPFFD